MSISVGVTFDEGCVIVGGEEDGVSKPLAVFSPGDQDDTGCVLLRFGSVNMYKINAEDLIEAVQKCRMD